MGSKYPPSPFTDPSGHLVRVLFAMREGELRPAFVGAKVGKRGMKTDWVTRNFVAYATALKSINLVDEQAIALVLFPGKTVESAKNSVKTLRYLNSIAC